MERRNRRQATYNRLNRGMPRSLFEIKFQQNIISVSGLAFGQKYYTISFIFHFCQFIFVRSAHRPPGARWPLCLLCLTLFRIYNTVYKTYRANKKARIEWKQKARLFRNEFHTMICLFVFCWFLASRSTQCTVSAQAQPRWRNICTHIQKPMERQTHAVN